MAIVLPSPTLLAAHQAALNAYLETALGFPFNYLPSRTDAANSPRGVALIERRGQTLAANLRRVDAIAAVRIVICHDDAEEGALYLRDWGEALIAAMLELFDSGLTVSARGFDLAGAFRGIKLVADLEFPAEDLPQAQGVTETSFNGALTAKYSFTIESVDLW